MKDPSDTFSNPPQAMPLAMVQPGHRVRFLGINAGRGLQARLVAMGLTPGVDLEVVHNGRHGPFIIAVKGMRLILGRGMAFHILVR